MTRKASDRFRSWIFDSFRVTPEGLALYRIFVALFILCFLLPSTGMYEFLGSLPSDFFHPPPGPMWIFTGFPGEELFLLLHYLLIASLVGMLLGYKTTFMSIAAGLLLLVIKGFFYSVGKINHEMLLMVVPILMAFSGWGSAWSLDSRIKSGEKLSTESWPLTLLALIIGFMMFTAGFTKLIGGWLDMSTQAVFGHYFNQFYVKGRGDLLAEFFQSIDNRSFWELLDYLTVLFEIGFLLAVLHPFTTRLFVCFAILFHFSTMLMLNISFLHHLLAYAAFLNWDAVYRKVKAWFPARHAPAVWVGGGILLAWVAVLAGDYYDFPLLDSDLTAADLYLLLLALPVPLLFLSRSFISAFRDLRNR